MCTVKSTRVLWTLAVGAFLLALPLASADHGPLPGAEPTLEAVETTEQNTFTSLDVLLGYGEYTQRQAVEATQEVQDGIEDEDVVLPVDQVDNIADQGFENTDSLIELAKSSGTAIIQAGDQQEAEVERFKDIMHTTLANALGVDPENPYQTVTNSAPACVGNLQDALDGAEPGEEIRVCAGVYKGPVSVDQHFVKIVAEQGPSATHVDAQGGHGFVVEGTGVTISGFRITGADGQGSAGVFVGSPDGSHAGATDIGGTTLIGNEFRYNTHGAIVKNAPGTVIALNTFWGSTVRGDPDGGVGVLVDSRSASDAPASVASEQGYGVLVAANNFQNNARFAIAHGPGMSPPQSPPTVAAFNHYNSPLGPNVEVGGSCHGPSAPDGDPRCRDGVGEGVVAVGFAPVEY